MVVNKLRKKKEKFKTEEDIEKIRLWERKWRNPRWRRHWRKKWGKNRWQPKLKDKWNKNPKWRRKWMKQLVDNWWNIKWRKEWAQIWLQPKWLNELAREKKKKRELLHRKWRKVGQRLGLTFKQFLVCERRLAALQRGRPEQINRRRKEKRLLNEKIILEKQVKRALEEEKLLKGMFCLCRWFGWMCFMPHFGPDTFGIRPAALQFVFYFLNAIHGVIAIPLVLFLSSTFSQNISSAFAIPGLTLLVCFACAMDIFGGFFGMIVALQLETYYGPLVNYPVFIDKNKKAGLRHCCFHTHQHQKDHGNTEETLPVREKGKKRPKVKKGKSRGGASVKNLKDHEDHSLHLLDRHNVYDPAPPPRNQTASSKTAPPLCLSLIKKCLKPGKSRGFVNALGYASWILLQLAWFFNILFTAYYTRLESSSPEYREEMKKCNTSPMTTSCDDFIWLYNMLLLIVGITFFLRNVLVFFIGMCFSERLLKRCQSPTDPNQELPSSCSETDIDFDEVPNEILYPYLVSNGKYPYIIPGDTKQKKLKRPKQMMTAVDNKKKKGKEKRVRRILDAQEKEIQKTAVAFKGIRREQVPLPTKGRRRRIHIPIITGVPDTIQLTPDLMTAKARAWLFNDDDSDDQDNEKHTQKKSEKKMPKTRRKLKKKRDPDPASLVFLHDPESKSKMPIEKIIAPKLKHLSARISTDDSWSGHDDSLTEFKKGYAPDIESGSEEETYMKLMSFVENESDKDEEAEQNKVQKEGEIKKST